MQRSLRRPSFTQPKTTTKTTTRRIPTTTSDTDGDADGTRAAIALQVVDLDLGQAMLAAHAVEHLHLAGAAGGRLRPPRARDVVHRLDHQRRRLGADDTLAYEDWPEVNEEYLQREVVEMAVQVNGTVRATIQVERGASEDTVEEAALDEENVQRHLEGRSPSKVIHVPDQLVNLVVE